MVEQGYVIKATTNCKKHSLESGYYMNHQIAGMGRHPQKQACHSSHEGMAGITTFKLP